MRTSESEGLGGKQSSEPRKSGADECPSCEGREAVARLQCEMPWGSKIKRQALSILSWFRRDRGFPEGKPKTQAEGFANSLCFLYLTNHRPYVIILINNREWDNSVPLLAGPPLILLLPHDNSTTLGSQCQAFFYYNSVTNSLHYH